PRASRPMSPPSSTARATERADALRNRGTDAAAQSFWLTLARRRKYVSPVRTATYVLAALLAVPRLAAAQPANDDCANATVVSSFPSTDTVDEATATQEPGEPTECGGLAPEPRSVWYRIPAGAADTLLRASTTGSSDSAFFTVTQYTGTCGALTEFFCD